MGINFEQDSINGGTLSDTKTGVRLTVTSEGDELTSEDRDLLLAICDTGSFYEDEDSDMDEGDGDDE